MMVKNQWHTWQHLHFVLEKIFIKHMKGFLPTSVAMVMEMNAYKDHDLTPKKLCKLAGEIKEYRDSWLYERNYKYL